MKGKRLFVLALSVTLGFGSLQTSWGQSANRMVRTPPVSRASNGGNELATTLPYMVLMAVFLGGGIYSFVNRRPARRGR